MKALQLESYSGPTGLRLVDVPSPTADDDVLLDVSAIGINYPDLLITQGSYQNKPSLPFVPGSEIAGTVISAPEGSGWQRGDRAAAFVWSGGYASVARVPLNAMMRVPDDVDLATAAGMIVNYQTVYFALKRRGSLAAGETVLILGAGGGIGSAAVQVARALGARVIAGVAGDNQKATAEASGADEVLVLEEGFAGTVRQLNSGQGVNVVLDPLGDWLFDEALRALAPEGRILVLGFAAGKIPALKTNRLLLRNASAIGVAFGAFLDVEPGVMQAGAAALSTMLGAGLLKPQIGARYSFEDIPQALEALQQGKIPGKAIADVTHP